MTSATIRLHRYVGLTISAAAVILAAAAPAWAQAGTGTGLRGDYYNKYSNTLGTPAGTPDVTRFENVHVNFGPGGTFPNPPAEPAAGYTPFPAPLDQDRNCVRWWGLIEPEFTENVTFTVNSDDQTILIVNGVTILAQGNGTRDAATIALTANVRVPIILEYIEQTGDARCSLEWRSTTGTNRPRQVVPLTRLYAGAAVAAPVITPNGGEWIPPAAPPTVTITCATPNSTIFYTTDGSDPGLFTPAVNAIPYSGPFLAPGAGRIRARAYAANLSATETLSNPFSARLDPASVAAPPNTTAGVYWQFYHNNLTWTTNLPNFDRLIPQQRGLATNFTIPGNPPRDRNDQFGLKFTGYVQVTTAGLHQFQLDSDEGSKLYIGPNLVVNNDGIHGAGQPQQGGIYLAVGYHPITVLHHDATGGESLAVTWIEPAGGAFAAIPNARLVTENLSPTPVITPTSPTFTGTQSVDITVTGGGTIYYTLNDEIGPDQRSFTGNTLPFNLTAPATIRAINYQAGFNPSIVASTTVSIPTGPRITSVTAAGNSNEVVVHFDRAMSIPTLSNAANFALDNGATVSAATPLTKAGAAKGTWGFEDAAAGTTAADGTGNGGTATLSNGATFVTDSPGGFAGTQAVNFSAAGANFVSIPDSTALRLGPTSGTAPAIGSFTVSLWMKPNDNTTARRLINKWDVDGAGAGNARGWLFDVNSNAGANRTGTFRFVYRQDGGGVLDYNPNFNVITAGAWQHVAVRVDRQAHNVTIFRNGTRVDVPANFNTDRWDATNTKPILLGRLNDAGGASVGTPFDGRMDEVRIFNVALSDTEIAGLAAGESQVSSAVRLTTGGALNGGVNLYTLTATGLQDRLATAMAPFNGTAKFHYYGTANVTRELFSTDLFGTSIGGSTRIADMVRFSSFPNNPNVAVLQATPVAATNFADSFGQRFRGYFIPNSSGFFRFAVSADDNSQLWLSGDEDPGNKVLVSHGRDWSNANGYDDADINQSPAVQLTVNQKYYFEVLYKEGGGGDNCAVSVIKLADANDATRVPVNAPALPNGQGAVYPYAEALTYGIAPTSRTVLEGEPVVFQAGIVGSGPRTYQWRKGTTNINGATNSRFTIANATAADAGSYNCVVSDGINTLAQIDAVLTVTPLNPTFTAIDVVPAVAPLTPPPSGPGSGGQTVTLTGTNLVSPWMSVTIGGVVVPNLVLNVGGTTMTAVTPAHAPGTVDVVLNYPTGQAITLANAYTYYNAPLVATIASVAPNTDGANGPIAGGQPLVFTGSSFINGSTTVEFGVGNFAVIAIPNSTTINVTAPAGAAGAVDVIVTTPFGKTTIIGGYTYHAPPTLVSISQSGGPEAPTALTLGGTNFALGAGLTRVAFTPGGAGTAVNVTGATSLGVTTPANPTPGTIVVSQVTVTTPGGTTGPLTYTYYPATQLTSIVSGEDRLAGGKSVVITGNFFSTTPAENIVTIAGNNATVTAAPDAQHLTVTAPALGLTPGSPTAYPVTVTTPNGVTVGGISFTYYPAPTVATPAPAAGANGGGDTVVLSGTNFSTTAGATTVTFNGVTAAITLITQTSITVTTPPLNPPGASFTTVPVVVSTTGSPNAATTFDYYPTPTLDPTTPISPVSGSSQGGNTITITGTNFKTGQTEVRVDGVLVVATVTPTQITFTAPAHDAATVTIEIKAPGGIVNVNYAYSGPRIYTVSPPLGPVAGGQTVTITGSGFVNGSTSVTVGGVAMTGLTVTAGTITFVTPAHAATPVAVDVVVTVTAQPPATAAAAYKWADAPTLTAISPIARGPMAGGQILTLTGTNFSPATTVTVDGVNAAVSNIAANGTSLDFTTPAHANSAVPVPVVVAASAFGAASTNTLTYTYVPRPTITSILPNRGSINGGQTVTITGTFLEANNQTQVSFGGAVVTASVTSATTATVVTPAHAAGNVSVSVSTFTPAQSTPGNFQGFTFVDPATAVDLSVTLGASTYAPGLNSNVTFTLTVANGPGNAASGVSVRCLLPVGMTFVSSTPSVGTYNSGSGQWSVGNLAASASATLLVTATVVTTNPLTVTAEVSACAQADIDSTPNNGVAGEDDIAQVSVSAGLSLALPPGPIGTSSPGLYFARSFAATGGVPAYSYALAANPDLPPLNFDPATGVLSGWVPSSAALQTYAFTVTVTDAAGTSMSRNYSLTLVASAAVAPVVDAIPLPPDGVVGVPYQFTFTANTGAGPYTWSSTGTLPTGLSLNSSTGLLAGTPTTVTGSPFSFTIRAQNGSGMGTQAFTIAIAANPVKITTLTLPGGTQAVPYDQLVSAVGGVGPTFNWTVSAGALPAPVAIVGTGRTITLSGAPTTPGFYSFTLRVQDGASGAVSAQAYGLTINAPGTPFTPSIPSSPPPGTLGQAFSLTLTAAGGTTPYTWALAGGALPTGLTLNAAGTITGTPTAAGVFSVSIQGTSNSGQSATQTVTIVIAPTPFITTASPLPQAINNLAYFQQLQATGGAAPLTWTVTSGTLPTGLTLNPTSGAISGIPTAAGGSFDVTVTDANGATDVATFTLPFISGGAGPLTLIGSLPPAHPGIPYSVQLSATGGTGPYTWSLVGAAPGISVDAATGLVFGTPGSGPIGLVQVQVTDSTPVTPQTALSNALVLIVPFDISMGSIGGGTVGAAYTVTLTVNGAQGTVVWTLVSGTLPSGLSLDPATGTISGTLSTAGTSTFQIQAADGAGQTSQQQFTVTVSNPSTGGGGGGGGGGCGLLGLELALLYALRRLRRK